MVIYKGILITIPIKTVLLFLRYILLTTLIIESVLYVYRRNCSLQYRQYALRKSVFVNVTGYATWPILRTCQTAVWSAASYTPASYTPASYTPVSYTPASYTPASYTPASYPSASYTPASCMPHTCEPLLHRHTVQCSLSSVENTRRRHRWEFQY